MSDITNKSFEFAVRVLDMSDYLLKSSHSYACEVCVKQVTRSGTSIGANIAEGIDAQSIPDLITKRSIALKEARETNYWLSLMHKKNYISKTMYDSMLLDLNEIISILVSANKTLKQKKVK